MRTTAPSGQVLGAILATAFSVVVTVELDKYFLRRASNYPMRYDDFDVKK